MTASPGEPEYLTTDDLAARYQVAPATIRKWRHDGTGPPGIKLGRHVRYRRVDVERWEAVREGR